MVMSVRIDTYSLLVEHLGEAGAYKLCETLGGTTIEVPKKQHKTFRIRRIVERALPIINDKPESKARIVKKLAKFQEVSECSVYRIIREVEYGK
jgi:hypothetical protein